MSIRARLITVAVPAKDLARTNDFYSTLLGQPLLRSLSEEWESYYAWASAGVKFTTHAAQAQQESVSLNFVVDDLQDALAQIVAAGGRVVHPSVPLTIAPAEYPAFARRYEALSFGSAEDVDQQMGESAVAEDPDGNTFIVTQLAPYAEAFFENGEISAHERRQHRAGITLGRNLKSSSSQQQQQQQQPPSKGSGSYQPPQGRNR